MQLYHFGIFLEKLLMEKEILIDSLQKMIDELIDVCPICGRDAWEYFGGRFHFGLRIEFWICPHCCLVVQSPRLREETLSQFYESFYRFLYQGNAQPTEEEYEFQKKRGRNLLSIFSSNSEIEKPGKILDFGCSASGLLTVARDEFQYSNTIGVELDKSYGDFARDKGFSVFSNLNELQQANIKDFDVITLSHVLEHISSLSMMLGQLGQLLKENGFLCIEVPHTCGGACFELTHLWGFNESSLNRLLSKTGFQVVHTETHGYPRVPDKPNTYLVVIAKKTPINRPKIICKSSPYKERKKRYLALTPNSSSWLYGRLVIGNTIKQLLGINKDKLVPHTLLPTKLARI